MEAKSRRGEGAGIVSGKSLEKAEQIITTQTMGVGYYCSLERPVEGVDPLAVDGKALAMAHFAFQSSPNYSDSPFAALDDIFSMNPEGAMAFVESEGIDLAGVEPPSIKWSEAATGLKIIRELLGKLRDQSNAIALPDSLAVSHTAIVTDLEGIELVLRAAEKEGVRFYLTCDTP